MEKFRTRHSGGAVPHHVYDLSLPLPERQQMRMLFSSAVAVASFLGVSPQRVYLARSPKHRIYSEAHGRWFAVRIAGVKTNIHE